MREYEKIWNGDGKREDAFRRADNRYPDYSSLRPLTDEEKAEARGRAFIIGVSVALVVAGMIAVLIAQVGI